MKNNKLKTSLALNSMLLFNTIAYADMAIPRQGYSQLVNPEKKVRMLLETITTFSGFILIPLGLLFLLIGIILIIIKRSQKKSKKGPIVLIILGIVLIAIWIFTLLSTILFTSLS